MTWEDDPNGGDLEAFVHQLASSSAWDELVGEYGVGALTVLPSLELPGAVGQ